jgi:gamma-glutamyltranspeptidase
MSYKNMTVEQLLDAFQMATRGYDVSPDDEYVDAMTAIRQEFERRNADAIAFAVGINEALNEGDGAYRP